MSVLIELTNRKESLMKEFMEMKKKYQKVMSKIDSTGEVVNESQTAYLKLKEEQADLKDIKEAYDLYNTFSIEFSELQKEQNKIKCQLSILKDNLAEVEAALVRYKEE